MTNPDEVEDPPYINAVTEMVNIGHFAAEHGWVSATSGNFSRRLDETHILVTRSGVSKGNLTANDLILINLQEPVPAGVSAETPLHLSRYRAEPSIGAILHIHSVASTVLSRLHASEKELTLCGFEMFKALKGFTTHETNLRIPIFANSQDISSLAVEIERGLARFKEVPAYLLVGHGMYVWGATMAEAQRHLEGLEFLLVCTLEERRFTR